MLTNSLILRSEERHGIDDDARPARSVLGNSLVIYGGPHHRVASAVYWQSIAVLIRTIVRQLNIGGMIVCLVSKG
jgi:hypothetical protein